MRRAVLVCVCVCVCDAIVGGHKHPAPAGAVRGEEASSSGRWVGAHGILGGGSLAWLERLSGRRKIEK
ncbi:hypothetical protein PC116_g11464 [Phytophthora cactorum]|nr:hypothetical protein Pcac1_g11112 [Phytophthora cactorum]KAG4240547.1 hypothetical protein PC116_g11464 [Phytophthora cactorum]